MTGDRDEEITARVDRDRIDAEVTRVVDDFELGQWVDKGSRVLSL